MSRPITFALIGALALGAAAVASEPAAAMPIGDVSQMVAASSDATAVEQVRFRGHRGFHPGFHRGFARRGRFFHRGFGYRRGFRHRPGVRIRRLLRRL